MKPINFELTKALSYSNGTGGLVECTHIELVEPTGRVSYLCCGIEAAIQSAAVSMADSLGDDTVEEAKEAATEKKAKQKEEEENGEDEEKDGDAMLAVMAGGGCDMAKVVVLFRNLFKEVALMGGEKKITSVRLDDMSHRDFRKMMGVYAANFIMS
jgi:hypothetical protein